MPARTTVELTESLYEPGFGAEKVVATPPIVSNLQQNGVSSSRRIKE
jgi:hypothetical protein